MRDPLRAYIAVPFLAALFFIAGCGYTTHSLLPPELKSIHVENFENKIHITEEQTDTRMYRGYKPGLEKDITKETIDKFLFDGNLKVANDESADLILKGELVDYRKEALRYDRNDNVEEYRILLVANIELIDTKTGKTMWSETNFSGEATYRTSGSLAKGESASIKDATQDLARRIVERTVEGW